MIYSISDLHLDYTKEKPMDIFGDNWKNHEEKIFENWKKTVNDDDLVLIPGDISWALKIDEAYYDLKRIDELPGKKIMIKGNHDYWWDSLNKLKNLELKSIEFIQNTSYTYRGVGVGGTRGWISKDLDGFDKRDEKIFKREVNRLDLSLGSIGKEAKKRIAMIHYPPFNIDSSPNEFVKKMKEHNVDICLYGHLHAEGHKYVIEGNIEGIEFYCVSSDYIDFTLRKIL